MQASAGRQAADVGSGAAPAGISGIARHPPGYRRRRFRNWFFIGLLYAGYYLCRYNLSTVTVELSRDLGLSRQQVGAISSGRDLGYAIGQVINGLFADALGGKQAMALGALGTVLCNLLFGAVSASTITWLLGALIVIRVADGYVQSFGAPGMVKINTSWFQRRERGKFAGIFGFMIQLGQLGVNQLSGLLVGGVTISALGISIARQDWRIMFYVPPAILLGILILTWLNVKNHPEEAGFHIEHPEDEHAADPQRRLPLSVVFRTVVSNPLAWAAGGAYFCTGFVRRAYDYWWAKYLYDVWQVDKSSHWFYLLGALLPMAAVGGSLLAGLVSDTLFRGRRSPVAAMLYGLESLVIAAAILVLGHSRLGSALSACVFLTLISFTCNSSHSIIGTAVAMDIGGRKMSGFALGIVNAFQYYGAILAGFVLGRLMDRYGWNAFFVSMLPFSLLGLTLMASVWRLTRGRDVKGA